MNRHTTANAEANLILRVIKGTTDFKGRSRRSEVLIYQIMVALIGAVIGFIGMMILPATTMIWAISAAQIIATIPLFALITRRLHDQNRSGWWGLIMPAAIVLNMIENYRFSTDHGDISSLPAPLIAMKIVLIILLLTFILCPGTSGSNRYGEDPRVA